MTMLGPRGRLPAKGGFPPNATAVKKVLMNAVR